jgi:hypothetical protein
MAGARQDQAMVADGNGVGRPAGDGNCFAQLAAFDDCGGGNGDAQPTASSDGGGRQWCWTASNDRLWCCAAGDGVSQPAAAGDGNAHQAAFGKRGGLRW